jgi:hypothetical protein
MNELKNVINPNILPDIKCGLSDCGHNTFNQQFRMKAVSKFQSPNGQAGYIVIPVYVCAKCGCELQMPFA